MEQALNNFPVWEQAKGAWGRAGLRPAKPPDGPPWLGAGGLPFGLRPQAPSPSGSREVISGPFLCGGAAPTLRD